MTSKERHILKEVVRKTILSQIDKPIKLKNIVTENYKNWEIGKVMTMKDNPPFKTPKQIKEEENPCFYGRDIDKYIGLKSTLTIERINDIVDGYGDL